MPDTRESGDGIRSPPVPVLARQPFGMLSGVSFRLGAAALSVAIAVSATACATPPPESTPETSPPVTDEQMERFCTRYQEVKDLSYSEMAGALIDYAPDNSILKHALSDASKNPPRGFPSHQFFVDPFISRCPPVEDPP